MRNLRATKVAWLAVFTTSFLGLNNCSNRSDSADSLPGVESASENIINVPHMANYPGAAPLLGPVAPYVVAPAVPFQPLMPFYDGLGFFAAETQCFDAIDNNGDGDVDCADRTCQILHSECSEWGPADGVLQNGDATTVYPSGALVQETLLTRNTRNVDDDDPDSWVHNNYFDNHPSECWINPMLQDPYDFILPTDPLIAGPFGPIGPLGPGAVVAYGPRAGLINECGPRDAESLIYWHSDDDNGDNDDDGHHSDF
jgi:hypothetical protein